VAYLTEQRGKHFDPEVVDAFLGRMDEIQAVRARFKADH
jgi:response regulator RpfG family c-di-GMP phosphodiesterase